MEKLIICVVILLLSVGQLWSQESKAKPAPEIIIKDYMSVVGDHATLYNGKEQVTYMLGLTNHPYLVTSEYTPGTISHNGVEYVDVMMRLDQYRDEIIVQLPEKPFNIVLENEKVNRAFLNDYLVVRPVDYSWENGPSGNYVFLLHEGNNSVIKKVNVALDQRIEDRKVEYTFRFSDRYYVCIDNVCYRVTSKKNLLKLFPDKRKELDAYARKNKLNFRKDRENSIVAIVKHYEALSK